MHLSIHGFYTKNRKKVYGFYTKNRKKYIIVIFIIEFIKNTM